MAFNGKLIELKTGNNYIELPTQYIKLDSYKVTPDQRMEADANRATSGVLVRNTVSHTATKIEFETPPIDNTELASLMTLINNAMTNALQRNVTLRYYQTLTNSYKEGNFYVPDIETPIYRIELNPPVVHYDSIRFAFIEY